MSQRKSPLDKYLGTLGTGTVQWIGVRPRRREPLQSLSRVQAVADLGLEGDHRMSKTPGSGRQVTLISREFLTQIAAQLGEADLDPARLRRNIVVSGLNLNALRAYTATVPMTQYDVPEVSRRFRPHLPLHFAIQIPEK